MDGLKNAPLDGKRTIAVGDFMCGLAAFRCVGIRLFVSAFAFSLCRHSAIRCVGIRWIVIQWFWPRWPSGLVRRVGSSVGLSVMRSWNEGLGKGNKIEMREH